MAVQTLEMHRSRHAAEPNKLSVTLWANTLIRTHGALESEVLYLLGVEPVWRRSSAASCAACRASFTAAAATCTASWI